MNGLPRFADIAKLLGRRPDDPGFGFLSPGPPSDVFRLGDFRGYWLGDDDGGIDLAFTMDGGLATVALSLQANGVTGAWGGDLPEGVVRGEDRAAHVARLGAPARTGRGEFGDYSDLETCVWARNGQDLAVYFGPDGLPAAMEYGRPLGLVA